jgi:hypothetical protein
MIAVPQSVTTGVVGMMEVLQTEVLPPVEDESGRAASQQWHELCQYG